MKTSLPQTVVDYICATNSHDAAAFIALFADEAIVDDAGREFRGRAAIKAWSDHDIFDARVTLALLDAAEQDDEVTITTNVDGSFDRTGLPDPLHISHSIRTEGERITRLTCRLAASAKANEPTPPGGTGDPLTDA